LKIRAISGSVAICLQLSDSR